MKDNNEQSAETSRSVSVETEETKNNAYRNYDRLLISVAKSDHINWVNNIVENVVRHREVDVNKLTDHLNCRFGKWYNSEARSRYGHLRVFSEIHPIHVEVHRKGKEMVENCRNKKAEEAKKCISEIESMRDKILSLLDELERAV
ncbi:MAG: CZB domain-containing protein [Bacillota bacterium]